MNQACPHLLGNEEMPEHRGKAAVAPFLPPIREAIEPGLSLRIVPFEREKVLCVETDQGRSERSFEQAIAPGIDYTLEKPLQFARFIGGKDTSITLHNASDASLTEHGLEHLRLIMFANKNGHVAVVKGTLSQMCAGCRQRGDVVTHPSADKFGGSVLCWAGLIFSGNYQPKMQRLPQRRRSSLRDEQSAPSERAPHDIESPER